MAQGRGRPKKTVETQVCFYCGQEKVKLKEFYSSRSPMYQHNDGRLPICKECIIAMYNSFDDKYKNTTVAIYRLCNLLDLYFDAGLLNTIIRTKEENGTQTNIAQLYVQKIVSLPQYKSMTSLNNNDANLVSSRIDIGSNGELIDVAVEEILEKEFEVTSEMIKRFGADYSKEEYMILQEKFENMCDSFDTSSVASIWIYENISKNYVEAERLRKSGNHSGYLKMLESISKMMGDCKIKPSQLDNTEDDNICFGNFIRQIENEEPIPEPQPFFKDIDNIHEYIKKWFIKPFARTLDLDDGKEIDVDCNIEIGQENYGDLDDY